MRNALRLFAEQHPVQTGINIVSTLTFLVTIFRSRAWDKVANWYDAGGWRK